MEVLCEDGSDRAHAVRFSADDSWAIRKILTTRNSTNNAPDLQEKPRRRDRRRRRAAFNKRSAYALRTVTCRLGIPVEKMNLDVPSFESPPESGESIVQSCFDYC